MGIKKLIFEFIVFLFKETARRWKYTHHKVKFHLLTTEEGGRMGPILLGYRPSLNIKEERLKDFITVKQKKDVWIKPGETREIEIIFLVEDWIPELNKEYLIQEGGRVVGNLIFII